MSAGRLFMATTRHTIVFDLNMFKMLCTLLCYVINELLKISKVFLSSAFAKGAVC